VITLVNGQPPVTITPTARPVIVVTQTPGVGPPGSAGSAAVDLLVHILSDSPHPAYDDQPSLVLIFENRLV
jgi:hypothetical protein